MNSALKTTHYHARSSTKSRDYQAHSRTSGQTGSFDRRFSLTTTTAANATSAENTSQPLPVIRKLLFKRHERLNFVHYSLWRIHTGYVRTLTYNVEGDFVPLGFWTAGDIVGHPVAQASPYIAECLTTVEAECLNINYPLSREMVINQVKQSTSLLQIAHGRDSQQRILQFVCWIAEQFGRTCAEGIQIHLRLTHQEIAESVGTTRVTVTRLLKALERSHQIIWNTNKKIVFTDTFERHYLRSLSNHR